MSSDEVLFPCPRCGNADQLRVGQSVFRSQLRWYESVNCEHCGLRTEADGLGFPPDSMRKRMLAVTGLWELSLEQVKSLPITARALREHLALGPKEALALLQGSGAAVVYKGTKVEVLWLAEQLEKVRESPQVSRIQ